MKFNQFDVVELVADLPDHGIKAGTVATIVDVYADGEYEIEITNDDGDTLDCLAVESGQIRHLKRLGAAA